MSVAGITAERLAGALTAVVAHAQSINTGGGSVLFPAGGPTVEGVLAEAAPPRRAELDHQIEEGGLSRVLEAITGRDSEPLVTAETLDGAPGMSGGCGLTSFTVGDAGYVCWWDDFDYYDMSLPILAAWTPACDEKVRAECVALVYEREWGRGLPPAVGGFVRGLTARLQDVAWSVLAENPSAWDAVAAELDDLIEQGMLDDAHEAVAAQHAADAELLDSVVAKLRGGWSAVRNDLVEGRVPNVEARLLFDLYAWTIAADDT